MDCLRPQPAGGERRLCGYVIVCRDGIADASFGLTAAGASTLHGTHARHYYDLRCLSRVSHAASARDLHAMGATLGITSTQPMNPMTLATPATTNADT